MRLVTVLLQRGLERLYIPQLLQLVTLYIYIIMCILLLALSVLLSALVRTALQHVHVLNAYVRGQIGVHQLKLLHNHVTLRYLEGWPRSYGGRLYNIKEGPLCHSSLSCMRDYIICVGSCHCNSACRVLLIFMNCDQCFHNYGLYLCSVCGVCLTGDHRPQLTGNIHAATADCSHVSVKSSSGKHVIQNPTQQLVKASDRANEESLSRHTTCIHTSFQYHVNWLIATVKGL